MTENTRNSNGFSLNYSIFNWITKVTIDSNTSEYNADV